MWCRWRCGCLPGARTSTRVAANGPRVTDVTSISTPSRRSRPGIARNSSMGQPADSNAPSVMSPLTPETQSK